MRINPIDTATQEAARSASSRLRSWLLHGPAQTQDGAHAGGVAGSVDERKGASYIYAEISGYYLLWLAGLGDSAPIPLVADRATRCLDWIQREFSGAANPATRIPLHDAPADWRNQAEFFFDQAMVLRGALAIRARNIALVSDELLANLMSKLSLFTHDGCVEAVRPHTGATSVPVRWSTTSGPFLLKATAAVDLATDLDFRPQSLLAACRAHLERCGHTGFSAMSDMLHPSLYFAEGLLRYGAREREAASQIVSKCLLLQRMDGAMPETFPSDIGEGENTHRNDVAAQALRLGLLLGHKQEDPAREVRLEKLARLLSTRVDALGRIAFDSDAQTHEANTWTAMFAEQALRWYSEPDSNHHVMCAELLV
ncbi:MULTISPECIES: hypothetical protein [unclassified Dyella]|uniref:hypothetical protein n=1 Tax=unclassified Dyella TaxID=2634549 RepID=UPI003F921AE0